MFNNFFFFENLAVYDVMWKNVVQPDLLQMTTRLMRIACWISKSTNINLEYVTVIDFPLQQWLHERAVLLLYMYFACLFIYTKDI